jgi:hypothetical protein
MLSPAGSKAGYAMADLLEVACADGSVTH